MKKNGVISNSVIWFGAGLSIAEIVTGTYFAPLGVKKALLAIILGHVIGAILMFFAGYIGAMSRKNSMMTTSLTFGSDGAKFFSSLNILQLVGWTAIMIYDGALACDRLFKFGKGSWSIIIGALVILWLLLAKKDLNIINTIAISALGLFSLFITIKIFATTNSQASLSEASNDVLTFSKALELSIAMPLSWLPLISDYTHTSEKPFAVTLSSTVVYMLVSIWMYIVGMFMSMSTGESNIANIISNFGGIFSIIGLYVVIFSTVTTTYLDAYSIGISSITINKSVEPKVVSSLAVAFASILAFFFNMDNITNFLYIIGSVFAPMIAIQIADYFVLKKRNAEDGFLWRNLFVWLLGFSIYRYAMRYDNLFSSTIPAMLSSFVLTILLNNLDNRKVKGEQNA